MTALILVGVLAVLSGLAYATHAGLQRSRVPRRRALPPSSTTDPLEGWRSPPRPLPPAPPLPGRPTRIRVVSRTPPPPGQGSGTASPWARLGAPGGPPEAPVIPGLAEPSTPSAPPPLGAPPPLTTPPPPPRRRAVGRWRPDVERRGVGGHGRRFRSTGVSRRGCPYCTSEIVDGEVTRACRAGHVHHVECIDANGGQCAVQHCGSPATPR